MSARPILAAGWAVFALAAALVALAAPGAAPRDAGAAPLQQATPTREPNCGIVAGKGVSPQVLLLGETAAITLSVQATCASLPLHVALVLDASAAMAGEPNRAMKEAFGRLMDKLFAGSPNGKAKVAVVAYDTTARTLCQLGDDAAGVKNCINRIGAAGEASVSEGIREGLGALVRGRTDAGRNLAETMIVLSGGPDAGGCAAANSAARQAKSQNLLLQTICMGPDCDRACMQQVASSPRYAFVTERPADLETLVDQTVPSDVNVRVRSVEVTDRLSPNMLYVADSARPVASYSPSDHTLRWRASALPSDGFTFTYRLQPNQVGTHMTSITASVRITDSLGGSQALDFPPTQLLILRPAVVPTPTVPGGTPTPGDTPTPRPATPSATPSATRTAIVDPPPPVLLPALLRDAQVGEQP